MQHSHGAGPADHPSAAAYWEGHYGQRERIWSGNPNQALVRETADLAPATALDLGCGEGADALWLASRGWRVTAVDVSTLALDRGRLAAAAAGVGALIDWRQHDLGLSFPVGEFELVSAQFLHSPVDLPRGEILRRAAAAVAPGGSLLIVGHAGFPPWSADAHTDMHFDTPAEVLAELQLPKSDWTTVVADDVSRDATGPDGQQATLVDSVLLVRRSGSRATANESARADAAHGDTGQTAAAHSDTAHRGEAQSDAAHGDTAAESPAVCPAFSLTEPGAAFVRERHLAILSTLGPTGLLHSVPVGFTLEDGIARIITSDGTQKVRNVERGLQASVAQVDGGTWISFQGPATVNREPEAVAHAVELYAGRYRRPGVNPKRVVIEIAVGQVLASSGLVDAAG